MTVPPPTPPTGTFFDGFLNGTLDSGFESLVLSIGADRSTAIGQLVQTGAEGTQIQNARVNELSTILQELSASAPGAGDVAGAHLGVDDVTLSRLFRIRLPDGGNLRDEFLTFDGEDDQRWELRFDGDFQRLNEAVRNEIDQQSSDSQLQLIELQGLVNRRNQSIDFVTNLVQRFSSLRERIVGGFRGSP